MTNEEYGCKTCGKPLSGTYQEETNEVIIDLDNCRCDNGRRELFVNTGDA